MNRHRLIAAFLIIIGTLFTAQPQAQFFQPAFVTPSGGGGGGCGSSQWNSADKGADITLSGSPCALTFLGGPSAPNYELVRSTTSKTGTGTSYYIEFTINTTVGESLVGVADSSATLGPDTNFCGKNTHSTCYDTVDGKIYVNGAANTGPGIASNGDVIGMKVDMAGTCNTGGGQTWDISFNKNGGAYFDPGTNSLPVGTTLFIAGSDEANNSVTVNFAPSSPPSGCTSGW